jgi:S1-C subfamily serine protease
MPYAPYFWLVGVLTLACFTPVVGAQVSSGTAFAVAPGLLITNGHVIAGCSSIEVVAADGRHTASIVDADHPLDLTLLRVNGLDEGTTARLRSPQNIRLGESVMVFGFPLAGSLSSSGNFTSGIVSALRGLKDAAGEVQITAPVQLGNSGGPLMDASGLVIGVVQAKYDALRAAIATGDIPQNVNFAISLHVLANFLARNGVSFRDGSLSVPLDTAQVAELAQSFTYRVVCRGISQQADASPKKKPGPTGPMPRVLRDCYLDKPCRKSYVPQWRSVRRHVEETCRSCRVRGGGSTARK